MAGFYSTSDTLDANDSITGEWLRTAPYNRITGAVFADQVGTIHIQQSFDGQNADIDTSYDIDASDGKGISEEVVAPWYRVVYNNGGTAQGTFRLSLQLRKSHG